MSRKGIADFTVPTAARVIIPITGYFVREREHQAEPER